MTAVTTLEQRYHDARQRIADAARRAGRAPDDIILVAVTKYAELDTIQQLIDLGHQDFAESRAHQLAQRAALVDELLARRRTMREVAASRPARLDHHLPPPPTPTTHTTPETPRAVRWHMIGHLQRNKVPKVAPVARLIHSVDSLRLVEELQAFALKKDIDVEVLVQVNTANEPQKYGCAVAAAPHLCHQIDLCANVHIRGLMAMAPHTQDPEDARPHFARLREVFDDIQRAGLGDGQCNILSMGMSGDFEVAIEEGANMIRLGSALVAGDTPPDHHHDDPADDTTA